MFFLSTGKIRNFRWAVSNQCEPGPFPGRSLPRPLVSLVLALSGVSHFRRPRSGSACKGGSHSSRCLPPPTSSPAPRPPSGAPTRVSLARPPSRLSTPQLLAVPASTFEHQLGQLCPCSPSSCAEDGRRLAVRPVRRNRPRPTRIPCERHRQARAALPIWTAQIGPVQPLRVAPEDRTEEIARGEGGGAATGLDCPAAPAPP